MNKEEGLKKNQEDMNESSREERRVAIKQLHCSAWPQIMSLQDSVIPQVVSGRANRIRLVNELRKCKEDGETNRKGVSESRRKGTGGIKVTSAAHWIEVLSPADFNLS